MAEILGDEDIPREVGLWQTFLFLLEAESPRMSEIRLGIWSILWAMVVVWPHNTLFSTTPIYSWLAPVPQAAVGFPILILGLVQLYGVLGRRTQVRLWSARIQTLVSTTFAIACTISGGSSTPAWAFFGLNALWSVWVLYRLAPGKRQVTNAT